VALTILFPFLHDLMGSFRLLKCSVEIVL
jgi:hypothetical protein